LSPFPSDEKGERLFLVVVTQGSFAERAKQPLGYSNEIRFGFFKLEAARRWMRSEEASVSVSSVIYRSSSLLHFRFPSDLLVHHPNPFPASSSPQIKTGAVNKSKQLLPINRPLQLIVFCLQTAVTFAIPDPVGASSLTFESR
jgi:hypothetical protein